MTTRLVLVLILFSSPAGAAALRLDDCAEYLVQGSFEHEDGASRIVVNAGSESAYTIRLEGAGAERMLFMYRKKWVQAEIRVTRPGQGYSLAAELVAVPAILPSDSQKSSPVTLSRRIDCSNP